MDTSRASSGLREKNSVSLVLDEGAAFIGDLPPQGVAVEEEMERLAASWDTLRRLGVTMVYPAHGPARPIAR